MMNNPHYLYRMTVLVAVAALAPVVSHDVLCNSMLPVVVAAAKDKVLSIADDHPAPPLRSLKHALEQWHGAASNRIMIICE